MKADGSIFTALIYPACNYQRYLIYGPTFPRSSHKQPSSDDATLRVCCPAARLGLPTPLSPAVGVEAARPRWLFSRFRQISVSWSARALRRRSGDGQSASGASSCYIRPGENTARAPRVEPPRPPENEPGESHAASAASPPSGPLTFIARNIHCRVLQSTVYSLEAV